MMQDFKAENHTDNGNPAGGFVEGMGLRIDWQNGPLGRGEGRKPANGAFVETVLAATKQRIEYYQDSPFKCDDNQCAIEAIEKALAYLNNRTKAREAREVEGTHQV